MLLDYFGLIKATKLSEFLTNVSCHEKKNRQNLNYNNENDAGGRRGYVMPILKCAEIKQNIFQKYCQPKKNYWIRGLLNN